MCEHKQPKNLFPIRWVLLCLLQNTSKLIFSSFEEYVRALLDRLLDLLAAPLAAFRFGGPICRWFSLSCGLLRCRRSLLKGALPVNWRMWGRDPWGRGWMCGGNIVVDLLRLSHLHALEVRLSLHLPHHLSLQVQVLVPQSLPLDSVFDWDNQNSSDLCYFGTSLFECSIRSLINTE